MARRQTTARRYAEAAFQIGREERTLDTWKRDLGVLRQALAIPELRKVLEHPALAYARKEALLRRVLPSVSDGPMNLALLMVRRGRPGALDPMVDRFEELLRRERGVVLAEVRSARALDDELREQVAQRLRALTGDDVEIIEVVDESLIGGMAVRIGDQLYDASVRSRLQRLRARLTA
jgi:F-type H+-transporting ATPase subunit delta